jgi:hypothetical protein
MMSSSFGGKSGFSRSGDRGARFMIPSKTTPELSPRNGNAYGFKVGMSGRAFPAARDPRDGRFASALRAWR